MTLYPSACTCPHPVLAVHLWKKINNLSSSGFGQRSWRRSSRVHGLAKVNTKVIHLLWNRISSKDTRSVLRPLVDFCPSLEDYTCQCLGSWDSQILNSFKVAETLLSYFNTCGGCVCSSCYCICGSHCDTELIHIPTQLSAGSPRCHGDGE